MANACARLAGALRRRAAAVRHGSRWRDVPHAGLGARARRARERARDDGGRASRHRDGRDQPRPRRPHRRRAGRRGRADVPERALRHAACRSRLAPRDGRRGRGGRGGLGIDPTARRRGRSRSDRGRSPYRRRARAPASARSHARPPDPADRRRRRPDGAERRHMEPSRRSSRIPIGRADPTTITRSRRPRAASCWRSSSRNRERSSRRRTWTRRSASSGPGPTARRHGRRSAEVRTAGRPSAAT